MIEISRDHGFRPVTLGIDLKTVWGDVKTVIDKGAGLLTPSVTPTPAPAPRPAPAPSGGTILGMPSGMVLLAGALAIGAGIFVFAMSKK